MKSIKQQVLDHTTSRDPDGSPIASLYRVTFEDESGPCLLIVPGEHTTDSPCYRIEDGGSWQGMPESASAGYEALADALAAMGETKVEQILEVDLDEEIIQDPDRSPKQYDNTVQQPHGEYVRTISVTTYGGDYTDDWNTMSEADRDSHDEWVEALHDALVAIAWEETAVRDRVDELLRVQEWQPATLRRALEDAKGALVSLEVQS